MDPNVSDDSQDEYPRPLNARFFQLLSDLIEAEFWEHFEDGEPRVNEDFPASDIAGYLYGGSTSLLDRLRGLKAAYEDGFFDRPSMRFLEDFLEDWDFDRVHNAVVDAANRPYVPQTIPHILRAGMARAAGATTTVVAQPAGAAGAASTFVRVPGTRTWTIRYPRPPTQAELDAQAAELDAQEADRERVQQEVDEPPLTPPADDPWTVRERKPCPPPEPPVIEDNKKRNNLVADTWDCRRAHWWRGQRMPPIGIRLRHLLNYLADEDVDRDPSWKENIEEIREYLNFVLVDEQFSGMGDGTKHLLREAIRRLAAHAIFEKWHGPQEVFIPDVEDVPRPAQRLRPIAGFPQIQLGSKVEDVKLPRQTKPQPRTAQMDKITNMSHFKLHEGHRASLASQEDDVWSTDGSHVLDPTNLMVIEQEEYEACLKSRSGWTYAHSGVHRMNRTHESLVLDGNADRVVKDYAREHGCRRAGLQQTLQFFDHAGLASYSTRWTRVQLPVPARDLAVARRSASGVQYNPPVLSQEALDRVDNLEPQPYTVAMLDYRRLREHHLEQARIQVEIHNKNNKKWPRLGTNAFHGVEPFPPYPAQVTDRLRLFNEMRSVDNLLKRAHHIHPRPLLREIFAFMEEGGGAALTQDIPHDRSVLHLRKEFDWKVVDKEAKEITPEEVAWLKFLVHPGSVNEGLIEDLDGKSKTLFLAFAERLKEAMEDSSEFALFPEAHTWVKIEDLRDYMHRGAGNKGMFKPMFTVYDAMAFCERLSKVGRCRFYEDDEHLAYVQRPVYDIHPEHLIQQDETFNEAPTFIGRVKGKAPFLPRVFADDNIGAPRRDIDVGTWKDVIDNKRHEKPLPMEIRHFFRCLAFRYGFTAARYRNKYEREMLFDTKHLSDHSLQKATHEWNKAYEAEVKKAKAAGDSGCYTMRDVVQSVDKNALKGTENMLEVLVEAKARDIVTKKLIAEANLDLEPLHPTRTKMPKIWDWGKPSIRGEARSYFNMNRWPLKLLTEEQRKEVESKANRDKQEMWDPLSEDPTPVTWYRRKAQMYEDKRVIYRYGPQKYTIGDTVEQRKMIQGMATYALLTEWGWNPDAEKKSDDGTGGGGGGGEEPLEEEEHVPGRFSTFDKEAYKDMPKSVAYTPKPKGNTQKRPASGGGTTGQPQQKKQKTATLSPQVTPPLPLATDPTSDQNKTVEERNKERKDAAAKRKKDEDDARKKAEEAEEEERKRVEDERRWLEEDFSEDDPASTAALLEGDRDLWSKDE